MTVQPGSNVVVRGSNLDADDTRFAVNGVVVSMSERSLLVRWTDPRPNRPGNIDTKDEPYCKRADWFDAKTGLRDCDCAGDRTAIRIDTPEIQT